MALMVPKYVSMTETSFKIETTEATLVNLNWRKKAIKLVFFCVVIMKTWICKSQAQGKIYEELLIWLLFLWR